MIKVRFFDEDYTDAKLEKLLVSSAEFSSVSIDATYYEDTTANESWVSDDAEFAKLLNQVTVIAVKSVNFVLSPNPDLAVVEKVIEIIGTGVVIEAPEVIIDPNVVY